jgi:hypothetical protein
MLGYYDWHRQTIAFRAQAGLFGTLQHELTHALIFWDIPMSPRWFEEGLAALYENTDKNYQGIPNPWRDAVLKRLGNPKVDPTYFTRVLEMDTLYYEHSADGSTLSRALMMRLQGCGDLAALYRNIREYSQGPYLKEDRPTTLAVARWKDMLDKCDCKK